MSKGTKTFYVDGGCIGGNPGSAIYWSVARRDKPNDDIVMLASHHVSENFTTNNEAEWMAILAGLKIIQSIGIEGKIVILSDSRLVVNQWHGTNKANSKFAPFLTEARNVVADILRRPHTRIIVRWVPRKRIKAVLGH